MPISTTSAALGTDWEIIAESVERCIVQIKSEAPAAIYVGVDGPDANSAFVTLSYNGDRSVSLVDLTTEKVWARSDWGRPSAGYTSHVAVLKG